MKQILLATYVVVILLATGCGSFTIEPDWPRLDDNRVTQTLDEYWLYRDRTYDVKQIVVIERQSSFFTAMGLARITATEGRARVIAMNELGMQLFDIEVLQDSYTLHTITPMLAEDDRVAPMLAQAIRHIYLVPRMLPGQPATMPMWQAPYGRIGRIIPPGDNGSVFLHFGAGNLLFRKFQQSAFWSVEYTDYALFDGVRIPGKIVYHHTPAGVKLTLKTLEVTIR